MKQDSVHRTIASFLLVLLLGYLYCIVSFSHVHLIDGTSVVHSHPYSDSANAHHQHTAKEYSVITVLSHYTTVFSFSDSMISSVLTCVHLLEVPSVITADTVNIIDHLHLRAPPVLFS